MASCTFLLSTVQLRALSTFVDMCVSIFHFVISAMLLSVVSQPLSNCLIIHKQYIMKYSSTSHDTTQEHDTVKPQYIKDDDDVKHVNTHCNKDIKCWQLDCTQQKQINVPGLFQSILLKKKLTSALGLKVSIFSAQICTFELESFLNNNNLNLDSVWEQNLVCIRS